MHEFYFLQQLTKNCTSTEKIHMSKHYQRTGRGTGMKPRMDVKCTWFLFKDGLSKNNRVSYTRRNKKNLLPILIKEKILIISLIQRIHFFTGAPTGSGTGGMLIFKPRCGWSVLPEPRCSVVSGQSFLETWTGDRWPRAGPHSVDRSCPWGPRTSVKDGRRGRRGRRTGIRYWYLVGCQVFRLLKLRRLGKHRSSTGVRNLCCGSRRGTRKTQDGYHLKPHVSD